MEDQIKIKFVKHNKYVYPKPYVFKVTPKDHKEFGEYLKPENEGIMYNDFKVETLQKLHKKGKPYSHFKVIELGHFDDEMHKPLKIDHMIAK